MLLINKAFEFVRLGILYWRYTYGRIDEYDEIEEWTQYVERMDHYVEANEIESNDKKRSIFLSVIGAKTINYCKV